MIVLPQTVRHRSTFRILKMPAGNWTNPTGQPWEALPMPAIYSPITFNRLSGTVAQGGYHVGTIARWCLPDEDRAEFYIDTGVLNGEEVVAADLANHDIRIQVYDDESFPSEQSATLSEDGWKTVFVGTVINVEHVVQPGGSMLGRTTYYCAGILWRSRNWPLNRHSTTTSYDCAGHPGYNIPLHGWFRKVLGNRDTQAVTIDINGDLIGDFASYLSDYFCHKLPVDGSGDSAQVWTDEQVVKHALISSRAAGEPVFNVDLSNGLFDRGLPWSVGPNEACWNLLTRVCNRQRGRGAVFVEYFDDPISGDVSLALSCIPSNAAPFGYRRKLSYQAQSLDEVVMVPGPEVGTTAVEVDLAGDHRLDGPFRWEDRYSSVFDHLVVQGEPIQVLCNLNTFGASLEKRWSTQDQTDFEAIPLEQINTRNLPRWRHVWRRFGFAEGTSNIQVKAEPADSAVNINYKTTTVGTIVVDGVGGSDARSSELTLKFLADIPIYEGWRYDGATPARWDASTDYLPPDRMRPVVMLEADKSADADVAWVPLTSWGYGLQTDDFGFLLMHGTEDQLGVRLLSPTLGTSAVEKAGIDGVGAPIAIDKLNTIIGVELGARVSLSPNVEAYEDAGRRLVMTISGVHLWLGAPGAIWELDYTRAAVTNYAPGLKFPAGNPYIIRDDRNELAFIAALAAEYYLVVHNPATWSLKDCGLLSGFEVEGGDIREYPRLGQMVKDVTITGPTGEQKITLNTNITSVYYEHESGRTTWRTDFVSYDGNIQ